LNAGPFGARDGQPADLALICRVSRRLCALPVAQVVETMRPLPIRSLGGVAPGGLPSLVLGLSVIRGAPTPVVDAGALLGSSDRLESTRWVLLRSGAHGVALAVESILGLRDLSAAFLHELPPLLREAGAAVIASIGRLDAELLLVLNTARILPESVWSALAVDGGVPA
jgi:purine-binding chemotaxis protein CheW